MNCLVFLLEEPSAREMLKGFLPSLLPDTIEVRYIVFEGKQDLEKQVVNKLKAWKKPDTRFVILRDQDQGNCLTIKQQLQMKCLQANRPEALVRIACRELESWYLGNLFAVEEGLGLKGLAKLQNKKKYREPDCLTNPVQELIKLTQRQYQKISGSRKIGPHMNSSNKSHSFNVFVSGVQSLTNGKEESSC